MGCEVVGPGVVVKIAISLIIDPSGAVLSAIGGWPSLPVGFALSSLTRIPDAPFFAKQREGVGLPGTTVV